MPSDPLRWDIQGVSPCPDARLIFADLHLGTGAIGSDHKTDFSTIGSLLEESIRPAGRYAVVLWTRYPTQAAQLEEFLIERLVGTQEPPVSVRALAKTKHLDDAGRVRDESGLVDEIHDAVDELELLLNKPDVARMKETLESLFAKPEVPIDDAVVARIPDWDVALDDWMERELRGLGKTPKVMLDSDDPGNLFLLQRAIHSIATMRAASHPNLVRDVVRWRIENLYREGRSMEFVGGPKVGTERTAEGLNHWMDTTNGLFGEATPRRFFETDQVDVPRLALVSARLDAIDAGAFS
ncbi:MAG: hypothetical protein F4Y86_00830 [Gammaproteobacteria bacterium]|nr:hypothetical protein [Gammaproteobacteria bacterium]